MCAGEETTADLSTGTAGVERARHEQYVLPVAAEAHASRSGGRASERDAGRTRNYTHPAKGRLMAGAHEPVAVLGIGAMGHGMAASALRAGIPTIVWNRRMEATRDLAELGAEVAESAADAARRAGIVVTMVTDAMPSCRSPGTRACSLRWLRARSGPR